MLPCDHGARWRSAPWETDGDRWTIAERLVDACAEILYIFDGVVVADVGPGKKYTIQLSLKLSLSCWVGGEVVGKASKGAADSIISGVHLDVFSMCITCRGKVIPLHTNELDSAMSSPKGIL